MGTDRRDLRRAAYARDEFVHASRVLLLMVGAKETTRWIGRTLRRDSVNLAHRLGAAALRADRVAGGYFDVVTTASGRHECPDVPEVF
jgi:hypothetical protein